MSRRKKMFLGLGLGGSTFNFGIDTGVSTTFTIPLVDSGLGLLDFEVFWGDGNSDTITVWNDAALTHDYGIGNAGAYDVSIVGYIDGWKFNNGGDKDMMRDISSWSGLAITELETFFGCSNMTISATNAPTITTTNLTETFRLCTSILTLDLNNWDVSSVTSFSNMFRNVENATTINIKDWDVSSATVLADMMRNANSLVDLDIINWDINQVSNLTTFITGGEMSTAQYDAMLIAWDAQGAMSFSGTASFGASKYTLGGAAETARTSLVSKWGAIVDGGGV